MKRLRNPLVWGTLLALAFNALLVVALMQTITSGRNVTIVIPLGTQAQIDRGETVAVVPARLEIHVGDTLRIENRDVVSQLVGPYVVGAGQVFEITYGSPGVYHGYCSIFEGGHYELVVSP